MTANQINYFKAQEEARSNRANEAIKYESNAISAVANDINRRNAETNALNANINLMNAQTRENEHWETVRANLAREQETIRANMANEQIKYANLAETQRSNMASENITASYNQGRLSQGEATLWDQEKQLHIKGQELKLEQEKFAEQQRHTAQEEEFERRKTNQGAVSTLGNFIKSAGNFVLGLLA